MYTQTPTPPHGTPVLAQKRAPTSPTSEAHVGVQNGIDELCDHLLSRGTHLPQLVRGEGEPGPLEIQIAGFGHLYREKYGKYMEIHGKHMEIYRIY